MIKAKVAKGQAKTTHLRLRPRIRPEADSEGAGGMLFDTQTAAIWACNVSAWALVGALRKGSAVEQLIALLTDRFDVDATTARKDVLSLVKELRALDMLEPE